MEALSARQQAVLDVIDKELKKINKVLKKAEPWIAERDKLMAARRALLSERSSTGGAGSSRTRLSMEEVVNALQSLDGSATVAALAEKLSMDPTAVRSHLNRHKDVRYTKDGDEWTLTEETEED